MSASLGSSAWYVSSAIVLVVSAASVGAYARGGGGDASSPEAAQGAQSAQVNVPRGRALALEHGCGDCHGGMHPGGDGWLAGMTAPEQEFPIGPFKTRPRNLTPDNTTGIGRFTERQLFNSIRYGLRPGETPDVTITSTTPGQGNFPENPKYLAPPMPWPAFRHMSDRDIRDIVAYLKRGVKPVSNRVADSEGPPDFWASAYTVDKIGPYPAVPFPSKNEVSATAKAGN